MTKKIFIILVGLALLFLASPMSAKDYSNSRAFEKPMDLTRHTRTLCNIGNWGYWVFYNGKSAQTPTNDAGGFYPRGTANVIYEDGFIWGGIVRDNMNPTLPKMRVGGQTYRIGTSPGWIQTAGTGTQGAVAISSDNSRVAMYRIRKDWATLKPDQASVRQDAAEVFQTNLPSVTADQAQEIIDQYQYDWENWPGDLGAPYYDLNGNGQWDSGVDEPGIAGADQVIWFVVNDLDTGSATNLYGSPPIGLELQVTIWAYNQPGATLGQLFFKKYLLINKSGFKIDSMFVSQWSDPDVGEYTDDLAGCDVPRSLGFAYSGGLTDGAFQDFNLPPAAGGYDFFQGPRVFTGDPADTAIWNLEKISGYQNMPMTSFGYFAAGSAIGDPELGTYDGTLEWYNLLNGFITSSDTVNPSAFTHGAGTLAGQATKFPVDGDPFRQVGDIDAFGSNLPPGDRRISLASGPFTMLPGDSQEVTVAVVGGIVAQTGGTNRNAVEQMKLNDDFAQFIFNNLFEGIPKPPAAPIVTVKPLEDQVILDWGSNVAAYQETEKDDPILGFNFEGYNVYQLPGRAATKSQAKKIATFDKVDFITIIRGKQFVPEFGDIIEVPIQSGTDAGIQRYFMVDRDYINGGPLYAGNSYYFAVTGYNFNPDPTVPEPALESALNIIEVVVQPPKPGEKITSQPKEAIPVTKSGPSTGGTSVMVVNPAALTGHDYKVAFNEDNQYTISTGDTVGIWHTWNLMDVTANKTLLSNQTALAGDNDYAVTDGVIVKVQGSKICGYQDWDYSGNRWISGVNWGGAGLFGGLDIGANFFGSTLTLCELVPVQLVFQDKADVDANGFMSKGPVYRRDQGYGFAGIGELPLAAYDVSVPDSPRRLNLAFVEMDDPAVSAANAIWDMGADADGVISDDLGAREYLFIMKSDYDEGAEYDDNNFAPAADVLYAIWPKARGTRTYLLAEFTLDIIAAIPNGPADTYTFSTSAYTAYDKKLAEADVEKVNVFPNPYYAFNPEEPSRFERFVTFNHLPQKAKIRIFNLAGTLVRTIDKDDNSQFQRWDLQNESSLPVGSGLYIVHIDMPDLGKTKVLKLFVAQGAEILDYF